MPAHPFAPAPQPSGTILSPGSPRSALARLPVLLTCGAIASIGFGLYGGLLLAPHHAAAQGDIHKILFIHVPATWMALLLYFLVSASAAAGLLRRSRQAYMLAEAAAPTGALFAFLALWTGSLWGKPVWGTWWAEDPRLFADLALLMLFLVIAAVHAGLEDPERADRVVPWIALPGALVVLVAVASIALLPGAADVPQVARQPAAPTPLNWTLLSLFAVALGFALYSAAVILRRQRVIARERMRHRQWLPRAP